MSELVISRDELAELLKAPSTPPLPPDEIDHEPTPEEMEGLLLEEITETQPKGVLEGMPLDADALFLDALPGLLQESAPKLRTEMSQAQATCARSTDAPRPKVIVRTRRRASTPQVVAAPVVLRVMHALPRLWPYALAHADTTRAQRKKLRELIAWMLEKEGITVELEAPTQLFMDGRSVKGRLELLAHRPASGTVAATPMLALETDFTAGGRESVLKLDVWNNRGVPTLWVTGQTCRLSQLPHIREQANEWVNHDSRWLSIYHLEHGPVPAG